MASALLMAAALVALALTLSNSESAWASPVTVLCAVSYVAAYGLGLGPVAWLAPAEFIPSDQATAGFALTAMCYWLANLVVTATFLALASVLDAMCFLIPLLVLLPFAAFVLLKVPETRGMAVKHTLATLRT
eukprot:CAMPEP_0174762900 /NCGR_PEP_ID=MMETSP1094-20130205/110013_1 /TAXON_ID=156173 /ORGANISM="Chrysochromulina brevifilum, Strain UTEX LB 985" /LENGTH=131 /DNA_ID=CAMNT_0015968857 /DNA_START=12 /DNA_END=407 /DNA_ORIENTATION=+